MTPERDANIASGSVITGNIGSNVTINGDATITNNNSAIMQRINNLTFADLGANSPIVLNFSQNGITVGGTTTLGANSNAIGSSFGAANQVILEGQVVGGANGKLIKYGNGGLFFANSHQHLRNRRPDRPRSLGVDAEHRHQRHRHHFARPGTPFGVGDVNLLPGTKIRLADASNIAAQKVTATSDAWALARRLLRLQQQRRSPDASRHSRSSHDRPGDRRRGAPRSRGHRPRRHRAG